MRWDSCDTCDTWDIAHFTLILPDDACEGVGTVATLGTPANAGSDSFHLKIGYAMTEIAASAPSLIIARPANRGSSEKENDVDDYASSRATRIMVSRLRSTSASVVAHDDTLMRMAVCPCQVVPPHQQVPSC